LCNCTSSTQKPKRAVALVATTATNSLHTNPPKGAKRHFPFLHLEKQETRKNKNKNSQFQLAKLMKGNPGGGTTTRNPREMPSPQWKHFLAYTIVLSLYGFGLQAPRRSTNYATVPRRSDVGGGKLNLAYKRGMLLLADSLLPLGPSYGRASQILR
jgi:hypothetical protein